MKRRTFLKTLGIITGTLLTSPVKGLEALASQGVKPVFQSVQAGNHMLTPSMIAREALRMLQDNLALSHLIDKDYTRLPNPGHKITIRRPPRL